MSCSSLNLTWIRINRKASRAVFCTESGFSKFWIQILLELDIISKNFKLFLSFYHFQKWSIFTWRSYCKIRENLSKILWWFVNFSFSKDPDPVFPPGFRELIAWNKILFFFAGIFRWAQRPFLGPLFDFS